MPSTTITMPALGESVSEGTVVKWLAKPGQRVERDQPLVEVATDKANTEIPSPSAGVLVEVLAQEGAVVQVGGELARLDDGAQAGASAPSAQSRPDAQPQQPAPAPARQQPSAPPAAQAAPPPPPQAYGTAPAAQQQQQQQQQDGNGHQRASPVVRNVA